MKNKLINTFVESRLKQVLINDLDSYQVKDSNEAYNLQEIVNEKLSLSGLGEVIGYKIGCTNKSIQKEYFKHSGYPGGEKMIKFEEMMEKNPSDVIVSAVRGMLPKNKLRDVMMKRLKVFSHEDHPFENNITKK